MQAAAAEAALGALLAVAEVPPSALVLAALLPGHQQVGCVLGGEGGLNLNHSRKETVAVDKGGGFMCPSPMK